MEGGGGGPFLKQHTSTILKKKTFCFPRAENTEKIEEYESKISNLLSGKTDTICQIKEGVESEFLERMTGIIH